MTTLRYRLSRAVVRSIHIQCVREFVLGRKQLDRAGGFVIACTHLSHLEPAIVSMHTPRHITWIARVEFFQWRWLAPILKTAGALPIDRTGRSVKTVRRAIELTQTGNLVGIFPEGGVATGSDAMFRGGAMKRGACVIAMRAGVPIVPCVVLGTEKLNRVPPWLPFKRARVWVAYGEAIVAKEGMHRRAARFEMAERLQTEIARTYQVLLEKSGLQDSDVGITMSSRGGLPTKDLLAAASTSVRRRRSQRQAGPSSASLLWMTFGVTARLCPTSSTPSSAASAPCRSISAARRSSSGVNTRVGSARSFSPPITSRRTTCRC